MDEYVKAVHDLEGQTGMVFGWESNIGFEQSKLVVGRDNFPLLLSVRTGSSVPMPGMLDSILNVGLNQNIVDFLAKQTNNAKFAYDTYRRFLETFGQLVLKVPKARYDEVLRAALQKRQLLRHSQFDVSELQEIISEYKTFALYPNNPWDQLKFAVEAAFDNWYSPQLVQYRDVNGISEQIGTAVIIQAMVHGNYNTVSGSGVVYTRNPGNGENVMTGEYLTNSVGEDIRVW